MKQKNSTLSFLEYFRSSKKKIPQPFVHFPANARWIVIFQYAVLPTYEKYSQL